MYKEVASRTNDEAGDGTTTATLLAQGIVKEGMKAVAAGMNPMDLKRGIDMATSNVVDAIRKMARDVADSDEVAQVGTISANGEAEIGKQIADAMQKVGNEGIITVELNKGMVLLHEKKLSSLQSMVPLLESVIQSQKPLLIR